MLQVLIGDVHNDRPWSINSYEGLNGGEVWTNMRVWMWARFGGSGYFYSEKNFYWVSSREN